jgi:hypothetical protein
MMFFKNGIKFRQRLFKTCMSPFDCSCIEGKRQCKTILIKEMCTVSVVFPLFCPTPVYKLGMFGKMMQRIFVSMTEGDG